MPIYIDPTIIKFNTEEKVEFKDGEYYIYERYMEIHPFLSSGFGAAVTFKIMEKWERYAELKDDSLLTVHGERTVFIADFYEFLPDESCPYSITTEQGFMVRSIVDHEVKGETLKRFGWFLLIEFTKQCSKQVEKYFPKWYSLQQKLKQQEENQKRKE